MYIYVNHIFNSLQIINKICLSLTCKIGIVFLLHIHLLMEKLFIQLLQSVALKINIRIFQYHPEKFLLLFFLQTY